MISFRSIIFKTKCRYKFHRDFSSAPIEEKQVKIAKWNINYIKVGSGPHHVFCLPGALGTIWTDYKPQIEGFDRNRFTLIVWDPPGFGKSRPPNKEYTSDFYHKEADYMYQFMRALAIPRYSVLGWSYSGVIAMIHAAKYPAAMDKLVLVATSSQISAKTAENIAKLRDINDWSESVRNPMIEVYGDQFQELWSSGAECVLGIFANGGNVCGHLLKDIKCPTLMLLGAKDVLMPVECSLDTVKGIAGSRFHVYPEGKHNVHIKYAKDFNKRVQDFLLQ